MKFVLEKASDWASSEEEVEIDSLEELKELQEEYKCSNPDWGRATLIIDFYEMRIMIYDNYIE